MTDSSSEDDSRPELIAIRSPVKIIACHVILGINLTGISVTKRIHRNDHHAAPGTADITDPSVLFTTGYSEDLNEPTYFE